LWITVLGACSVSPESPQSNATFSGSATVRSARATSGDTFHGGAPQHKWVIVLGTTEGCAGDEVASVEINTLSGVNEIPLGPITVRPEENVVPTLPSAFFKSAGMTATGGTVTIDSGGSFVVGSWAITTAAGDVTATFGAPVCP